MKRILLSGICLSLLAGCFDSPSPQATGAGPVMPSTASATLLPPSDPPGALPGAASGALPVPPSGARPAAPLGSGGDRQGLPPGGPGRQNMGGGPGGQPPGPPPGGMAGGPGGPLPGPPPGGFGPGGQGGPGGADKVETGHGALVLAAGQQLKGGVYGSSQADENAIRADGNTRARLLDVTVEKNAGAASNNEASSFYGLNAAVLALGQAHLTLEGGSVQASAEGATGVFAYDGATIYLQDTDIQVTGGNAGGIEVAGGGTLYARNLTVSSADKAAIRSDRGGGKLLVEGGRYRTQGHLGAPVIYSTADIQVHDASLMALDSEAVVIEGFNSVSLVNSQLSGHMQGSYDPAASDNPRTVMLYQSMSGDANEGTSHFSMQGGSLASGNGDLFYVTNTASIIDLHQVAVTPAQGAWLLKVAGNDGARGWGRVGANGGRCTLNLTAQLLTGDIRVDAISSLTLNLRRGSVLTGTINADGTQAQSLVVSLDAGSRWILTQDSHITALQGDHQGLDLNGHQLYVAGQPFTP
ncbi:hypothetical protein [Pseudaeromonas paramecii]|uniref:hypothetical protein n=1 Tax=Pseudaeromonas paramecii TaxID=2138166 RepID=UPI0031EBDCCC